MDWVGTSNFANRKTLNSSLDEFSDLTNQQYNFFFFAYGGIYFIHSQVEKQRE